MFSSAFKIKSWVVTATAVIASVSLVLGRPQDRRLQARDSTDDFQLSSNNGLTLPGPSDFQPSSPDGSLLPSIDLPNLGLQAPETLSAVPQSPGTTDPTLFPGLSTDWTKTLSPPVDGASKNVAIWPSPDHDFGSDDLSLPMPSVEPDIEKFDLATDAVNRAIDSVSKGNFVYVYFEVSPDHTKLAPTYFSNLQDWRGFAFGVRDAPPSYVLRSTDTAMLLIYTHQNLRKAGPDTRPAILGKYFKNFQQFVESRTGENADAAEVYDNRSLYQAISPYYQG